jgi:hypothetical protein
MINRKQQLNLGRQRFGSQLKLIFRKNLDQIFEHSKHQHFRNHPTSIMSLKETYNETVMYLYLIYKNLMATSFFKYSSYSKAENFYRNCLDKKYD